MKWRFHWLATRSSDLHALGIFVYWEVYPRNALPNGGKGRWGRIAIGLDIIFWTIGVEYTTDDEE